MPPYIQPSNHASPYPTLCNHPRIYTVPQLTASKHLRCTGRVLENALLQNPERQDVCQQRQSHVPDVVGAIGLVASPYVDDLAQEARSLVASCELVLVAAGAARGHFDKLHVCVGWLSLDSVLATCEAAQ